MKKGIIAIIVVVIIGIIFYSFFKGFYNTAITLKEDATAQWGNVESAYQRRADLIPNIVNTAKGYAEFEQKTLTDVIEARSKATSVNIDPANISPEQLAQFQQAQSGVSSALSRLLVTVERYPDLKANENFKELINELERTENRINVERNRYNDAIRPYNKHIKTFPNNIVNNFIGNFEELTYFESNDGAENASEVNFDDLNNNEG
ncbi:MULTISPECIES: LemA family protein [unclassified Leeuwenhoekiella]|uniref:LemA family protein n=1 Tax=unclassified Leeuwenhoekiella TaxID=2615029 RepID=UPI000C5DA97E|nr:MULTISPECIES: LemA family protein [unclassified Leeuwenhoekiella]MBA80452.1 LemA family protein [Leeuwenhoekiella sp.]|tara:strand:+ start:39640 stop:40257 length:618 start_codon:yes stop_codon:yes gene_type:complete